MELRPGDRVKFLNEKQRYTVRAVGRRYAILTKPFNPRKTVLYTILDFVENVRGTENLIFCAGFESHEDCKQALERLENGDTAVSRRNFVPLEIEEV